ncbi:MAG: hypothetical protein AB7K04_11810 [Pseudorhodoplanes sp.]
MITPDFVKRLDGLVASLLETGWDATRFDMPPHVAHALSELLDAAGRWERMHKGAALRGDL